MELAEKVFRYTEENALFRAPATVLLGLSGGADSVALLHLLCHWPAAGLRVVAVHIHHGIRGREAARDEQFVRAQCAACGVPLYVVRADVPAIAAAEHMGLEEAGRQVRYAVFARLQQQTGAAAVLTAHTASDQVETVLLHLLRGCGTAGLCGIPARRGAVVRPLLGSTREEIEAYCAAQGVAYITDSTNADPRYTRNAVRHRVLPLLRQINPAADAALLRLSAAAAQDEACLSAQAQQALAQAGGAEENAYAAARLEALPPAVFARAVRLALERVGCRSAEQRHIAALRTVLQAGHGCVQVPGGFALRVHAGRLLVEQPAALPFPPPAELPVTRLPFPVELPICPGRLELEENVHKMFFKYTIDYDKIQSSLRIRCRLPGDRLHPAGRGVGKSVKALMNEQHIPPASRAAYPLLCDAQGIVLIPGIACDERVKPDAYTKHFLVWRTDGEPF